MSTTHHTAITDGAAANAATINTPLGTLDAAIVAAEADIATNDGLIATNTADIATLQGGATISNETLKEWAESGAFQMQAIIYYGTTGTIDTGTTVLWPDGATGTVTVIARSVITNSLGLIDSSSVTHTTSGLTITQPAYTRDANGQIITQPALVVA